MSTDQPDTPRLYHPTPIFRGAALFLLLSSVYLATEVWRTGDPFVVLFFVVVLVAALGTSITALASASFDGETLIYRLPLRPERRISRAQIIGIEVVGRRTKALLINYHPRNEQGEIDFTRDVYLNLAPLQDQMDLLARLQGEQDED
jgi:hypothetical protein